MQNVNDVLKPHVPCLRPTLLCTTTEMKIKGFQQLGLSICLTTVTMTLFS